MNIEDVAAAKAAMLKAQRKAAKAAAAQYKLNELHRKLGEDNRLATKRYEAARDAYVEAKMNEAGIA